MIERGEEPNKLTFIDYFSHFLGKHRKRISTTGVCYCRICGEYFEREDDQSLKEEYRNTVKNSYHH